MSDLLKRLNERAAFARSEGNATALGDALHFEEASTAIRSLREIAIDMLADGSVGLGDRGEPWDITIPFAVAERLFKAAGFEDLAAVEAAIEQDERQSTP